MAGMALGQVAQPKHDVSRVNGDSVFVQLHRTLTSHIYVPRKSSVRAPPLSHSHSCSAVVAGEIQTFSLQDSRTLPTLSCLGKSGGQHCRGSLTFV